MLKKISAGLFPIFVAATISACSPSPEKTGDGQTLATINGYRLTIGAFERQLASELELEKDYKLTESAKKDFLETLIGKELLIQEAVRLKLDRKEIFTKAIEKYWESTLIRDLIDLKSRQIGKAIVVTQEEIEKHYNEIKQSSPEIGTLNEEVQAQLRQELKAAKKSKRLSEWIDQLRDQADIEIDEALLSGH
jgi:hypothetical protein